MRCVNAMDGSHAHLAHFCVSRRWVLACEERGAALPVDIAGGAVRTPVKTLHVVGEVLEYRT